jgi:hypothetical protein
MPSEQRVDRVLSEIGESLEGFRSAVARAVDEVRAELEKRRRPAEAGTPTDELGALASRLMDPSRFAGLFAEDSLLDPEAYALLEQSHDALARLDAADDEVFVERVPEGGDLRAAVEAGLGRLGVAFGAARVAELAREGRYRAEAHAEHMNRFPPSVWNRAERGLAPPLVLETPGAALRGGLLAEFLDGTQKLVLVVEGAAPPAPLVRLITPGVLVLQTEDPEALRALSEFDGPAVAALYPEGSGAAHFTHDPRAGRMLADRLSVEELPESAELRAVGPITAAQQAEELTQLAILAGSAASVPASPSTNGHAASDGSDAAVQPADRLAAWLLRQANLRDVG